MTATERFRAARDFLLETRLDYDRATREFTWPRLEHFNWALDWFDVIARGNDRGAAPHKRKRYNSRKQALHQHMYFHFFN